MKRKMYQITESEYYQKHKDFRGVYSSDDIHGTNWNGRRTLTIYNNGTVLLIEGESLEIIPDHVQP